MGEMKNGSVINDPAERVLNDGDISCKILHFLLRLDLSTLPIVLRGCNFDF